MSVPIPEENDLDTGDNELYEDEIEQEYTTESTPDIPCTRQTRSSREFLKSRDPSLIAESCREILDFMTSKGFNLPTFLYYMSWTDQAVLEDPVCRYQRTALMWSEELPIILANWHKPPRAHGRGIHTRAAGKVMDQWAEDVVKRCINRELRATKNLFLSPQSDLSEESLLSVDLGELVAQVKQCAPLTWSIFHSASWTPRQEKKNTTKTTELPTVMSIAMAQFGRSHHRCRVQKYLTMYFRSNSLSAKGYDTGNALDLTMSHSWLFSGVEKIAERSIKSLRDDVKKFKFRGTHDNINMRFVSYEQRLDNKTHFDSGAAATIYMVKDPSAVPPNTKAYRRQLQTGSKMPIRDIDIYKLEKEAAPRLRQRAIYDILRILIESRPFQLNTYEHHESDVFKPPPPVMQLPTGPEHATCQYMLGTEHREEASYDGNEDCMRLWMQQLGLDSPEEQRRIGEHETIIWIGDQLTVSRLRGIKRFHSQDLNSAERLECLALSFGWFHFEVNAGHSFHNQYYCTSTGVGLKRDFDLLDRRGLGSPSTQGNFHASFEEGLTHVAEARFRDLWCTVSDLLRLAEKIYEDFASTKALLKLRKMSHEKQDDILIHAVQFNRDVLIFLNLNDAIKTGDVGRMRDVLPRMLFRFIGGGNHNYTAEVLELIQGLEREWPSDMVEWMMKYCWLANSTGKEGLFKAFDLAQEHNIKDIKGLFLAFGPHATWEYIKKISAAIPTLRKIKDHVEATVNHYRRGKSHSSPEREEDVAKLQEMYAKQRTHAYTANRHLTNSSDVAEDYIGKGCEPSKLQATIKSWASKRVTSVATTEDWEYPLHSDDEDNTM
ncbi:uncharacterized protein PHACADRAFT_189093 [Phanerochaete carnosa HHB-10118-sp]|uniref:DUF6589 domain-containing protein n=1 Tax=Phanerochaete carnosa (strain HHB-10118-sp) TaxID=650164 RepID=K5WET4_PHACS|nr:uncharacterized protein PHACADRAFT_189093 [Phanerochaete carnosa HHB-10118-sp]EKM48682.1 hypothetical protein PHACADRAFT_189093 [Phanerochaete carnosa HHB-10118-sp]